MHKISLKDWVILLTIVPTTIIGFILAGYFSYARHVELNDFLTERAHSIIEPLAIASTDAMLNEDRPALRRIISLAHRSQSSIIKSIAVFTQDNQVFVTSAYHGDTNVMRIKAGETLPLNTTAEEKNGLLIFRTPIISELDSPSMHMNTAQNNIGYIAIQVDKTRIELTKQSQILTAFIIAFFGSIISAFFSFRLIKNFTRPINSMVQAVDRIREGKLESRVSGQLIGELNFLKNGVNAMAQSLGDYQDEMQGSIDQATTDLRESLEQFEIQNVELDIAKRKAQEANKVKSEFLANMSHELRTPLNGVIGFTRQVLKTPLTNTQRDYLQTIERSAANLLAIINDILDFSKLDAGKMVIESVPFSMRESIEETLTLLAPSAHKKNIELSLRIQEMPDALIGDAMRIKQVIINLAGNAIKFTDKGSVDIDIECEHESERRALIKVTVTDSGIGMNAKQQQTIFEAFGQADKSVTRLYGGTGLGLVISQRLVAEMNGDMGFHSGEDKGSTFWFNFECEINPMPLNDVIESKQLENKEVLYFEPHTHSRIATSEIMASWQMQVTPVADEDALNIVLKEQHHFDYILIGHDVTPTALISLKKLISVVKSSAPSIHLAINSNSPNLQEALIAAGADSCLSKPVTPERLSRALLPTLNLASNKQLPIIEDKIPIKVLAVDDNDANLKLIKALLLEQVEEVITATNGQEAVELCKNEKYALIFMDIQMPIMDGISALKNIKAATFNEETPMIAVTAHALSEEKDKLLKIGFNSYLTKPIDEAILRHTIYEYCDLNLLSNKEHNVKSETIKDKTIKDKTSQATKEKDTILSGTANESATQNESVSSDHHTEQPNDNLVIDWQLALKRAGKKTELAKDMLKGLVKSLPETKTQINEALTSQDVEQLKVLIHKLNGACCYSGVPNLGKITHQIETELKSGIGIDDLEPEFFEFFEQLDNVLLQAPLVLESLKA